MIMVRRHQGIGNREQGFTLIELVVTGAISTLVIAGLTGVIQTTIRSKAAVDERIEIARQANFAMDRIVRAVSLSRQLMLPLADNPATNWPEHIREQTVPASPPIGDSTLATAVLAVTLPEFSDLDFDGFPDADNDRDGRIDEDIGVDATNDAASGIYLIDDNGNGQIDEYPVADDDEDNATEEDSFSGLDEDGDGSVDEDSAADMNADGCPGNCGVDDDGDGAIDEGGVPDDDESGVVNEDPFDAVVFHLDGDLLRERTPVPWDENGSGMIDGRDFVDSDIASQVTRLRFERMATSSGGAQLVDITLELTSTSGEIVSVNRRVRIGGAL